MYGTRCWKLEPNDARQSADSVMTKLQINTRFLRNVFGYKWFELHDIIKMAIEMYFEL